MDDRFERSHDAQARERYRTAIPPWSLAFCHKIEFCV